MITLTTIHTSELQSAIRSWNVKRKIENGYNGIYQLFISKYSSVHLRIVEATLKVQCTQVTFTISWTSNVAFASVIVIDATYSQLCYDMKWTCLTSNYQIGQDEVGVGPLHLAMYRIHSMKPSRANSLEGNWMDWYYQIWYPFLHVIDHSERASVWYAHGKKCCLCLSGRPQDITELHNIMVKKCITWTSQIEWNWHKTPNLNDWSEAEIIRSKSDIARQLVPSWISDAALFVLYQVILLSTSQNGLTMVWVTRHLYPQWLLCHHKHDQPRCTRYMLILFT